MEITANTAEVIEKVDEARKRHVIAAAQALEGFDTEVHEWLAARLEDAEAGRHVNLNHNLSRPVSYEGVYDDVLVALRLHKNAGGDQMDLNSAQVRCLIQDKWDWSEHWNASNAVYINKSRGMR